MEGGFMRRRLTKVVLAQSLFLAAVCGLVIGTAGSSSTRAQEPVSFTNQIKPILESTCWGCHSTDLQLSKLDLSTHEGALRGGARGPSIVPGSAEQSRLFRVIAGLETPAMPLGGTPLTVQEIALIKTWIDEGAHWDATPQVSFAASVRPLFEYSCWNCHGGGTTLSGLDLSTREGALKGGVHGPALVPGKAEESRLYRRLAGLEKPAMPLEGTPPSAEQIAAIKAWIDAGAPWDTGTGPQSSGSSASATLSPENAQLPLGARDYWAFKLPVQAPLPAVAAHLTNPIDRFLEKTRQEKGLKPAPRADRLTLLRRAYLDLIGMPPSPAQTAEFLADNAPGAWARLIDKLLAMPQYGERWGRHWLDVARYADSSGYEVDKDRPNAWRYRDYVIRSFNEDKPYNVFLTEQLAGDEMDGKTHDTYIATEFLRAGPRVELSDADNPQYRYDYMDDMIATVGRGTLGLTLQCARCHNHKFDPLLQKDYYALQAIFFGHVETTRSLVDPDVAEAYAKQVADVDARQAPLRAEIRNIEAPYREKLLAEVIKRDFPPNVQAAIAKPESDRTEGEKLLATQVLRGGYQLPIDKALTPEHAARKKALNEQIAAIEKERPAPLPTADIVTDGDYRFAPLTARESQVALAGRDRDKITGTFLHEGPGRYEPPPAHLLIRGDMNAKGALMKPGFVTVATYGNPPTEIERPDGHTSGRRLALAQWLGSRDNPLPARVIVNRVWSYHFGRGIVASLDNFGKMGELPTHQELLDWLAVEFINQGWSFKQMHRLMMTSEAYQMASRYEEPANRSKDPDNLYLWKQRIQRLDAEVIRDSIMTVAGTIDLSMGGPAIYPHVPEELLKAVSTGAQYGAYKNQPDGPAVWRRSVYMYTKRNLPFPMMVTFDQPDLNFAAGARLVSTLPTQALTLMNNAFVVRQAGILADRVKKEAGDNQFEQIDTAYRIVLTRPPTETELGVALDLLKKGSLVDLTNVLLNLSEFVYAE
jgi:hypothetical protein